MRTLRVAAWVMLSGALVGAAPQQKVDVRATLLNVDGMFLAYPGFQGDPDVRLAFNLSEAQELYKLAVYDYYRDKEDDAKLSANIKRYMAMTEAAVAYKRPAN